MMSKRKLDKLDKSRVSTKWLNLLRKMCALFVQIFFFANFCAIFAHETQCNEFCAIFFAQNRTYFLRNLGMKQNFSFAQFVQNFLGKLSKIDILSLELNN